MNSYQSYMTIEATKLLPNTNDGAFFTMIDSYFVFKFNFNFKINTEKVIQI
jgi:hypothetical protein